MEGDWLARRATARFYYVLVAQRAFRKLISCTPFMRMLAWYIPALLTSLSLAAFSFCSEFSAFVAVCSGATRPPATVQKVTHTLTSTRAPFVTPPAPTTTTTEKLPPACPDATSSTNPMGRLREAMKNSSISRPQALNGYIVFHTDEHLSDEPAAEERRLEYISGWDGPGTGVVLADGGSAIWVGSNDLPRAIRMLSCAWRVIDADNPAQPTVTEWIVDRMGRNGKIGGDARLVSMSEWQRLNNQLQGEGFQLVPMSLLVDQLWNEETNAAHRRPEPSKIVAYLHKIDLDDGGWRKKVALVREELRSAGVEAMVVSSLDEVAWLLNVRGRDVPYAPLLKAFVVVGMRDLHVYAPPGKIPMPVREALAADACLHNNFNCTQVHDYGAIYTELRWRSSEWGKILIPTAGTFQRGASAALAQSVPLSKRVFQQSPIIYLKAQKSKAEAAGMKKAHVRDAVAMCTFFSYMEDMVKRTPLTEILVGRKVDVTRETQAGYVGVAMQTRVAYGPSGADPDYRPLNTTNRRVLTNSTLIINSGGQYEEGTTIVTRTLHFGSPTHDERRAYTSVLRSLGALARLKPPSTLPAAHADPVARAPLWAAGQDYMHPSGHGIGAVLNRREDPVVIDYRQDTNLHTFKEGYFVTNEPAWYEPGKFGIRLGNVLELIHRPKGYLAFREATLIPYEPKLIDRSMLTEYEITWLNNYNERIRKEIGPELESQGLQDVYYWMMNKTVRIEPLAQKCTREVNSGNTAGYAKYSFIIPIAITLIKMYY